MDEGALFQSDIPGLKLLNRGKVRDIYETGNQLVIVASDRLSAFDSVLPTPIPLKGKVLTALTLFWLDFFGSSVENHLITADVNAMPEPVKRQVATLAGRTMLVRKAKPMPVECVVRGYLSGSGWKSYQKDGTVCGVRLPAGLKESSKLPEPIFTPTTKAESGHDQPLDFAGAAKLVGEDVAKALRDKTIDLYRRASEYAAGRG
ncbi:MAG TPA: phosphoribosylaminoimidazolesuccinocarboxamide synthase, partial [Candidatus Brocadiia bacterium]|nr:phosphoribosylaminoimidazolesuccinocarboxamide synthase [Candidatus Brocadiia bacterium]